jgi:hypothetical protein
LEAQYSQRAGKVSISPQSTESGEFMPPGIGRTKPSTKVLEKVTVKACVEVARRVEHALDQAGNKTGAEGARLVAMFLQQQLGH